LGNILFVDAGILKGCFARLNGSFDQIVDQLFELGPRKLEGEVKWLAVFTLSNEGLIDFCFSGRA